MPVSRNLTRNTSLPDLITGRRRWARLVGELIVASLLALGIVLAVAHQAAAQSASDQSGSSWRDDWDVTVGGGALYAPTFAGSDSYEVDPLPFAEIVWRDRVFLSARRGLGGTLLQRDAGEGAGGGPIDGYSLGLAVRPSEARDEDDDDHLTGLGDVDLSAEAGLFAALESGMVEFGAELYQDIGDGHEGLRGSLSVGLNRPVGERLFLGAEATIDFADKSYMESFFGVSSSQAARSSFSTYDAGAGIYSMGLEVSARYRITRGWGVTGILGYSHLVGDAADSPIVEEEGAIQAGAFVTYTF